MNKSILLVLSLALAIACGKKEASAEDNYQPGGGEATTEAADPASYDPKRGEGKFDTVELGATLDQALAKKGEEVAGVKCAQMKN
jgi:hypothetical protein